MSEIILYSRTHKVQSVPYLQRLFAPLSHFKINDELTTRDFIIPEVTIAKVSTAFLYFNSLFLINIQ